MTAYRFEPLTRSHDRAGFQCGAAVLDRYLRDFARKDAERGVAAPYLMVEEAAPNAIVGYYTLSLPALPDGAQAEEDAGLVISPKESATQRWRETCRWFCYGLVEGGSITAA